MQPKACALCSRDIETQTEPAVLFVGKYGRRYEICSACERLMDTFVSGESESERTDAAKRVYGYLFNDGIPKSPELLSFFKELFAEGDRLDEAKELLSEEESTEASVTEAEGVPSQEDEALISEEEFLADREKPTSLVTRLVFLLLFLLLGGGTLFYGIVGGKTLLVVVGAIIALLGTITVFSS